MLCLLHTHSTIYKKPDNIEIKTWGTIFCHVAIDLNVKVKFWTFRYILPFSASKINIFKEKIIPLKRLHTFLEDPDEKGLDSYTDAFKNYYNCETNL